MTKEQSFFIQILADHLNGRKTRRVDDLDWGIIHQYALNHQVNGIVYTQAKDSMPPEAQNTFLQETLATIYCASNRANDFDAVKKGLKELEIPFFVVKGPMIADLYPSPMLRVMGDIDLVIQREKRDACHELLLKNGYECVSKQDDREWQYVKNKMELELHDRLVYEETVNEAGQDIFFNDCWRYVEEEKLDWDFHLLFLIFHLRKHFMNAGVGFRQFMDLAVVSQKTRINWDWMKANLEKTGMYHFALKCYGFIERWFGIKTVLTENIEEDFYEGATQIIFSNGVFGVDNADNITSMSINIIRKSRYPRLAIIKQHLIDIFPAWELLSNTTAYKYLKKGKLLLPIAWIHRWLRVFYIFVFAKGDIATKRRIASMKMYNRRMEWMRKWSLIDE